METKVWAQRFGRGYAILIQDEEGYDILFFSPSEESNLKKVLKRIRKEMEEGNSEGDPEDITVIIEKLEGFKIDQGVPRENPSEPNLAPLNESGLQDLGEEKLRELNKRIQQLIRDIGQKTK